MIWNIFDMFCMRLLYHYQLYVGEKFRKKYCILTGGAFWSGLPLISLLSGLFSAPNLLHPQSSLNWATAANSQVEDGTMAFPAATSSYGQWHTIMKMSCHAQHHFTSFSLTIFLNNCPQTLLSYFTAVSINLTGEFNLLDKDKSTGPQIIANY